MAMPIGASSKNSVARLVMSVKRCGLMETPGVLVLRTYPAGDGKLELDRAGDLFESFALESLHLASQVQDFRADLTSLGGQSQERAPTQEQDRQCAGGSHQPIETLGKVQGNIARQR